MTVVLNLTPDIEAGLMAQAQAEGFTLGQFLSRKLRSWAAHEQSKSGQAVLANAWEGKLDEWLDSFSGSASLSEDAMERDNWHADRW